MTSWVSIYKHITANTDVQLVSDCSRYRKLARTLPQSHESVLEIGCSTGLATQYLAQSAQHVVAVDTSASVLAETQQVLAHLKNVQFAHLDARDVAALSELIRTPDVIFIDIGGDRTMTQLLMVLRPCLLVFLPRLIVIRNFELAMLHTLISAAQLPEQDRRVKAQAFTPMDANIGSLVDLSYSEVARDRVYAAKKLSNVSFEFNAI